MDARHLVKRGRIWHLSLSINGTSYRTTTKTADLKKARAIRDELLAKHKHVIVLDAWKDAVDSWSTNSGSWLYKTYSSMEARNKKKCFGDMVTFEQFKDIVCRSNGRCALSGIAFDVTSPEMKRNPFTLSPDRIDSSKGYTFENIRIVCMIVNLAMSHWGDWAIRKMACGLVGVILCENTAHSARNSLEISGLGRYAPLCQGDALPLS